MSNQQSWKRWKKNHKRRKQSRQRNLPRDSPAETQDYRPVFSHNYQANGTQVRPLLLRGSSRVISRYLSVLNVSCLSDWSVVRKTWFFRTWSFALLRISFNLKIIIITDCGKFQELFEQVNFLKKKRNHDVWMDVVTYLMVDNLERKKWKP